jgi:hypothetical protein
MGFNDKFALQKSESWLFSNFGRALALAATDAAVLGTSALYGRASLISNRRARSQELKLAREQSIRQRTR